MDYNTALIDADVLLHKIGFACQKKMWGLFTEDDKLIHSYATEELAVQGKNSYRDVRHLLVTENSYICSTLVKPYVISEPISVAIIRLKQFITNVKKNLQIKKTELYLSHTDSARNRRYEIAVTQPYKDNRKKLKKPELYNELREYMVNKLGAIVAEQDEADDMLGYEQCRRKKTIIVSIDKDLLQIPGWHYNPDLETTMFVQDPGVLEIAKKKNTVKLIGTGFRWFCAQMLLGDAVDNIKGLDGFGVVFTHKLLSKLETEEDCWNMVKLLYKSQGHKEDRIFENAQLLWISREPGQRMPKL